MSIESDLYSLYSTDASISAVLDAEPFVYNGAIPKGQPDSGAIVLNIAKTDRLTGSDGPNRFTIKEVQIDSYHEQYTQALAISNAVFSLMTTLSGSLATTEIQGTIPTAEMDFGREPSQSGSGYVFRRMLRFEIQHTDLQAGDLANTYTPSGVPAPGGNATLLEGVPVAITSPTDGQVLVYNASTGKWGPGAAAGGGSSPNFADSEVPTGAVNGVNPTFTWLHTPASGSLMFFKNGQRMTAGIAYTLAANVATFNAGYIPQPGDDLAGSYRY